MAQDVSAYIPKPLADAALIWLRNRTIMARLVHRDFENDPQEKGKTVDARRPQTFTAADVSTPIDFTALVPETVQVVLDKWKHVTFAVSDNELAYALRDPGSPYLSKLITEHIQPAAQALAEAIDNDLLALYADIVDAGTALNNQKAPAETRYCIISPAASGQLLKLAEFSSAQWDPANVDALRSANLGPKYGFAAIVWSQLVDSLTATPIYQNLGFHRDAFALVVRPLATPAVGTLTATAVDPESGLSVRLEIGRSIQNKRTECSLDVLYGVKTLNAALAVKILST